MAQEPTTYQPRILIVTCDEVIGADLASELNEMGYRVSGVAGSGPEAVSAVERERPDLILLDTALSEKTLGLQTAGVIRSRFGIPSVFITDSAGRDRLRKSQLKSPFGIITKPIQIRELEATLEAVIQAFIINKKRLKAELDLRKSEEFSTTLLNVTPNPILVVNPDKTIRYVNPAFTALTGYESGDLEGSRPPFPWWPEDDRDRMADEFEQWMNQGLEKLEACFFNKNKEEIWVEITSQPVFKNEELQYYVANWVDLTARKKIESQLIQARREKAAIMDAMAETVMVQDRDHRILWVNKAAADAVGMTVEDMVGKPCHEIMEQADHECMDCPVVRLLKTGRPQEVMRSSLDGRAWLRRLNPLFDDQGEITGVVEVGLDMTRHKLAEESLRASEEKLYQIILNMPVMVNAYDEKGNFVFWNRECERITGFKVEDMVGNSEAFTLLAPDRQYRERMYEEWKQRDHDYRGWEWKINGKDGRERMISISNLSHQVPIPGWASWTVGVDITDQKNVENALRESEERFRLIFNGGNDAIFLHQINDDGKPGKFLEVNDLACERLGYTKEEFAQLSPVDIGLEDNGNQAETIGRELITEKSLMFQTVHVTKTGQRIPVESNVRLIVYQGENAVLSIARDITDRINAENALRQTARIWQRTFDAIEDPLVVLDGELKIIRANQAILELFPDIPVVGQYCYEVYHGLPKPVDDCVCSEAIRTGRPLRRETPIPILGDKIFEMSVYPYNGPDGQLDGLVHRVQDITDRKKTEENIKAALQEKEVLLREIHHRVKNNLQVVSSLLNLQASKTQDEKGVEALRESQNRITAMALVHEALYRSTSLAEIDLSAYVKDLMGILNSFYMGGARVDLTTDIQMDLRVGLEQAIPCGLVINELVSNALKHAFPDNRSGNILISANIKEGNRLFLEVRDDGVGMPTDLDLENPDKLGMVLVKGLVVDQLKGELELNQKNGSTITISFPIKEM